MMEEIVVDNQLKDVSKDDRARERDYSILVPAQLA